ncbi:hypothetical protein GP486_008501 [Trichoglossum hirsutum]|uniref:Rhomboid family protein n=1 Tax=Trichoglossum hirsutum TaxID=265104 RepID=A0A9P8L2Z7_9PEZI|nr:hypothetical protein GP486_008501 [Trichoglossum hirsutum]
MPPRINLPPLTRFLLGFLVGLSVLTGALRYRQWNAQHGAGDNRREPSSEPSSIVVPLLTIVPQLSLFYPWVFVVATLVEQNLFTLAITAATIFYGGKYLERAWGSPEFAKFVLVVSVVPNLSAFATYILWFAVTGDVVRSYVLNPPQNPASLNEPKKGADAGDRMTTICGGVALQAGFLVAFKQLVPEHTVTIAKGIIRVRVKHFPALFLLTTTMSGIIFGTDVAAFLAWYGFLSSWTFLRFYKTSYPDLSTSQQTLKGDASETFAFAYFFPEVLHGPISTISDSIYNILVALRICTPFSAFDISAGNSRAEARGEAGLPSLLMNNRTAGGGLPGSARAEAERRRALALKALDQRLHAATSKAQSAGQATVSTMGGGSSVLGETNFNPEGHEEREGAGGGGGGGGDQSSSHS